VWIEEIAGERFTSVEPTPWLAECIEGARAALERALGERARVAVSSGFEFDPSTRLVPSILVSHDSSRNGGSGVPDLVVELRTESTGRYILGPKRMVYSRFGVPEFWYVDPRHRKVAVLRSHGGRDYDWPPLMPAEDESIELSHFPGVSVPVRELLGPASDGGGESLPVRDAEAWLAS
jgi:Uma2 family endonuclease